MRKFTEAQLESAIIQLLGEQGYPHTLGGDLSRSATEVLIRSDLRAFLSQQYASEGITDNEINGIIRQLELLSPSDLYDSNKTFCRWLSDGFLLKREDPADKDIYIQLIDYSDLARMRVPTGGEVDQLSIVAETGPGYQANRHNIYKIVNQLEIEGVASASGGELRIPDGILYINGLPLVLFEFKSAIREEATIHDAYVQICTRYRRDIPQLFIYNALCVISDGVNNKLGNLFAPYEYYYGWRKISGNETVDKQGIDSLNSMVQGLFDQRRLREVIRHFIYFPDKSHQEIKIVCRYPQYYAATKLYQNIKQHQKKRDSAGNIIADDAVRDGKGGTYFGATGCGKSFTMQFLARLLMKSVDFESPTIVLITDRTDLDDQLSQQFTNAKTYIGDQIVETVASRADLRAKLQGRQSGGVFLTTIHKFTEDVALLTDRCNVICISDEAHRSQINLDQKISVVTEGKHRGVRKTYGFAKYLHDSLPNATYVGFTGTPIDATLDVFGCVVDSYTMNESVRDEITVRIVYEGRAAKVILDNSKLKEIEAYYQQCADDGASNYQIDDSKKAMASMGAILGDPDRIQALAKDFVAHYEDRVAEGSTVAGKAMFVSSSRQIAYQLYQELQTLRPEWFEVLNCAKGESLSDKERKAIKASARVRMVMTRNKDDDKALWNLLGSKDDRKALDRQFKLAKSNFKIAIVVDMWLTGFDVPFLDTMYIDKPVSQHNLIQTISRVNRKFEGKSKGLVVDYIGIKTSMNKALKQFGGSGSDNFEDIAASIIEVRNHLDLLNKAFYHFDSSDYFTADPVSQLNCLNRAGEYAQQTEKTEKRFMDITKRLKAAYDICCGNEQITKDERDHIHFYMAIRSIIFKLIRGTAPDTAQMNAKVRGMIAEAIKSDGVEEIFKLGEEGEGAIDIFDEDYLAKIDKIKLPNTKIKLLQKLLEKAIGEVSKTNRMQAIDFSKKFKALVDKYNERREDDVLVSSVLEDFSNEIIDLYHDLKTEMTSFADMGIDYEEKAFYDILKSLSVKYDFFYPKDKMIQLAKRAREEVESVASFPAWNQREDIKAELQVKLILLLAEFGYPPVANDDAYKAILEQAENFKKHCG
ncbi:HsdR family type I site-specific deoxyribonuclease [uncultured Amphritea sp.]|uniref:type I restriction endonuclease subunit R n=1 Tax=uncultured Amphritea sp. TaxID=981605 RepID=UPI002633B46C|nr:HsdR family type I site-specific deoxyribonuclease [uncultured Amphritea sp.]